MNEPQSPTAGTMPKWYFIVSIVALLWNLMGLTAFGMIMSMSGDAQALADSGLNEEQVQLMLQTPGWVNVAFAVAVIGGTLGSIGLVMKRRFAVPVLILSLIGVLAQSTYVFFLSDSLRIMGAGLSPLVIPIAIALVPFAVTGAKRNWLK